MGHGPHVAPSSLAECVRACVCWAAIAVGWQVAGRGILLTCPHRAHASARRSRRATRTDPSFAFRRPAAMLSGCLLSGCAPFRLRCCPAAALLSGCHAVQLPCCMACRGRFRIIVERFLAHWWKNLDEVSPTSSHVTSRHTDGAFHVTPGRNRAAARAAHASRPTALAARRTDLLEEQYTRAATLQAPSRGSDAAPTNKHKPRGS